MKIFTDKKAIECSNCIDTMANSKKELGQHLIIETDCYTENKTFILTEFPTEINVKGNLLVYYISL